MINMRRNRSNGASRWLSYLLCLHCILSFRIGYLGRLWKYASEKKRGKGHAVSWARCSSFLLSLTHLQQSTTLLTASTTLWFVRPTCASYFQTPFSLFWTFQTFWPSVCSTFQTVKLKTFRSKPLKSKIQARCKLRHPRLTQVKSISSRMKTRTQFNFQFLCKAILFKSRATAWHQSWKRPNT